MWNFSVKQLAMSKCYEISIECRVDNRPEEDESSRGGWKNWTFPGTTTMRAQLKKSSHEQFSLQLTPILMNAFRVCCSAWVCIKKACMNRTQKSIMVLSSNRKRNLPPTQRQLQQGWEYVFEWFDEAFFISYYMFLKSQVLPSFLSNIKI